MANSSLLKTIMHNSIADGIYNEIVTRQSRYYYFLGKTLSWEDELLPPFPTDSVAYENSTRNEIITMKDIKQTDVSYVIPRYDYEFNKVYDQYDDEYCTEVIGVNLISSGFGYGVAPFVYIGSQGSIPWVASSSVSQGQMITSGSNHYIVTTTGVTGTTAPTHTVDSATNGTAVLKWVEISNGSGTGATAVATILDGNIIDITLTSRGTGYTSVPTVTIAGGNGEGGFARAVVSISASNKQKLEDCAFYVITDEYNVYKCLDNNNGAVSTYKPIGTTVDPITLPDGYMWKFMYSVPIALRNKFLTESYIPVVTALRNQFYSNGSISTVKIDQLGSGYTGATITVQGDGYLESDPLYLTSATIANGGSGYTTPTLSFSPPFSNTSSWLASTLVISGQKISHDSNIYEVAVAGQTGTLPPTHKSGIVSNGTAALKYIGTTVTGQITLSGGVVNSITLYGMLRTINITNNGTGYTSAPTVTFTGGGGTGASATAVLQNGSVIKIIINDNGKNYTTAPTVRIGTPWTASTALTLGTQIFQSNRLYTVTVAGTTNTTAPTHTSGSATNGTATLTYAGIAASATTSLKYGAGYSSIPTVSIIDEIGVNAEIYLSGVKSEATLIPIIDGGQVTGVQIDDGGVGYTYVNLNVVGDGTGSEISADLSPGDINSLQANIELLTIDGRIMNIPVVSGGYGYGAATVTVEGDGAGCTATATIVNGSITKINITNYGSGYRWARVTISGSGYGAKARAIISPYGGHGKEALNNLFARTLMFYSNVSNDKNQGFVVNNDYRQIGIIKNPRQYNSTYAAVGNILSACWVISATTNTALFPADSIIRLSSPSAPRFRIVTNTGTALLLQSLDNASPVIGSLFISESNNTFSASAVTPPSIDKYSGDLMFIDNKQAFTPTEDQNVTLRTVIKF